MKPQRDPTIVGVFVDCTTREVSFYDADTGSLLYSHTGCVFIEFHISMKDLFLSIAGNSLRRTPKLYPIFGVYEFGNSLAIAPSLATCKV